MSMPEIPAGLYANQILISHFTVLQDLYLGSLLSSQHQLVFHFCYGLKVKIFTLYLQLSKRLSNAST